MHIGTWNVRTLHPTGALDILVNQLDHYRWQIVGLCETHLLGKGELHHGDYHILLSGREDGKHRDGVALVLARTASAALLSFEPISPRLLKARFKTHFGELTVVQSYAPTSTATDEEMDLYYKELETAVITTSRQDMLLVMGDFNAKVGTNSEVWRGIVGKHGLGEENERGERLLNFCASNNLVVTNTWFEQRKRQRKWTWISPDGRTKNLIDFILVNKRWKSSVLSCRSFAADVGSDHKLVLAKVKLRLKAAGRKERVKCYNLDKLGDTTVKEQFMATIQSRISLQGVAEVEGMWSVIKEGIHSTAEEVLGSAVQKKKPKWISDEVLQLCQRRKELREKIEQGQQSRTEYNWLTRQIKHKSKRDKEEWLAKQCGEAESCLRKNDMRGLYTKIKDIGGTVALKNSTIKDKDGRIIDDDKRKLERWKEYFNQLYNVNTPVDRTVLDELVATNEDGLEMPDFTEDEVKSAIRTLKKRKAPGIDGIMAELLQAGGEHTVTALHCLFQKVHEKEQIPEDWGKAIITPIYKKGDKSDCKNYRGISLLSVPGKVFTKVLQRRMKCYVEEAVAEEQAGFRPGRGTVDQLFTIRQIAEKYIEHNQPCYFNFIDFKQAFDSIWQEGLWQSLRAHGIPEKMIRLIKSIYDKAMAAVRHDCKLSEWFRTTVGVRQGCTLSPDLFNLVLEVIMRMAVDSEAAGLRLCGRRVSNLRFADDINLMAESPEELQAVTDQVNQQSVRLGLIINIDKTKVMAVGDDHRQLHIQINGKDLEQVKEFVYLGGVVSDDGRCIADIKRRIGLTYAAFNKIGNIWNCRSLSLEIKRKVFESLIAPILLYGSECWTMRKEDERRISVAEMSWLRKIRGVSRLQHIRNEDIRSQLGVRETMVERVKTRRLQWFGHVSRMNSERLPYLALHTQLEGNRSRGRQRTRWRDNVRKDIEEKGLEFRKALSLVKDREKWMEFVRPHRRYNS